MKKQFLSLIVIISFSTLSLAQVGINTDNSAPDPSAQLDIKSNAKGLLIPRLTTLQRNAIPTPAIGLMVFDTDLQEIFIFNVDGWKQGTISKLPLELSGNGLNILKVTNLITSSNSSTAAEFKGTSGFAIIAENAGNPPTMRLTNAGGSALEAKSLGFGSGGFFQSESGVGVNIFSKENNAIFGSNNSGTNPTAKFTNNNLNGKAIEANATVDINVNNLIGLKVTNSSITNFPNITSAGEFISKGLLGLAIKAESAGNPPTVSISNIVGTALEANSTGYGIGGYFSAEQGVGISVISKLNSAIYAQNNSETVPTATFRNFGNGPSLNIEGNLQITGKIINETYQYPIFENSWSNFGGDWNTAKFYKGKDGRVYLEGVVTGGSNTIIYTLPIGYRPAKRIYFMVSNDGNGRGRIDIQANGVVSFDYGANRTQVGLDGISFRVD